ncbi:MAG: FAD-binding protein [Candidatus Zixiibacteriota bacterium]|nr:MAG: FAD-binding protein [candidate division Zixibacteria bacterium]
MRNPRGLDFSTNRATLSAYASDGSIYQVQPHAVGQVFQERDIQEAVNTAVRQKLSITPRGAGTGLAGGALGSGLILDFGRFNNVLEIDVDRRTVLVQPGIIYDELNRTLSEYGLFFPPDPSSGDSCQIGGMIANNASGPRSVKYGLTSHFIEELDIVDAAGRRINLKNYEIGSDELKLFFERHPEYHEVLEILQQNRQMIRDRWPKLRKNSAGYNLLQVTDGLDAGFLNLPALMTGSEGTLAIFAAARLRLLPLPAERLTARVYFGSLVEAGEAVSPILELAPSGLEIVDGATLDLIGRKEFGIPEEAAALLLIEFDDSVERCKESFLGLAKELKPTGPIEFADNPEATASLWKARKAIVPTLYRHHPTKRPISLVEDVSLPHNQIPSFIQYATALFEKHNLTFGMFGHIGDGNLHIRPLFDMNNKGDFDLAGAIYNEIYDKIISLGGSTTAEHADGRLRASVLRRLYGDEIFSVFRRIKTLLDPDNILSPDSILSEAPFTEKIDFEKLKSYCAACGKCNGYCPAYDLFRREDFSPRGWLRILNQSGASRRNLDRFLSYCLNCKNCTDVCPAGVDIAAEIIAYRSAGPSTLSKMAVSLTDRESFLNIALRLGKLSEPLLESNFGKFTMELFGKHLFGIDKSAKFPRIAKKPLRKRFSDRHGDFGDVGLFHGCADNLLKSQVGDAVFKVFDRLGIKVLIPEQKCCGLPQETYGHCDNLRAKAEFNIERLKRFDGVITGCASCLLKLKEYPKLFDDGGKAKKSAEELAAKCYDISQFLNRLDIDRSIFGSGRPIRVTYHDPCHLRMAGLQKEPENLIRRLSQVEIIHPVYADRCCAQAGSYGFVHFQESKRMFKKKKDDFNRIKADYIMTSCPACQMKIRAEMDGNFKVVHPVEILAERMRND